MLLPPLDLNLGVFDFIQARVLEWVAISFSRELPNPGIEPRSPELQVDSLPAEPPGKTKKTGLGRLSLLQGIFLTQRWDLRPLHWQVDSLPLRHLPAIPLTDLGKL